MLSKQEVHTDTLLYGTIRVACNASKTCLVFAMYHGTHAVQSGLQCSQTEYASSVLLSKAHLRWLICIFIIL